MTTVNRSLLLAFLLLANFILPDMVTAADNRPWGGGGFNRPDKVAPAPDSPGYRGRYNPWIGQELSNNGSTGKRRSEDNRYREERERSSDKVPSYGYGYPYSPYSTPYGGSDGLAPYPGSGYPYDGYSPLYGDGFRSNPYPGGLPWDPYW